MLLLLMQILDSDRDFPAFDAYFDAYYTDFAASDAHITAYDGEFAVFVLHLLFSCSFSSSIFDSATADAGTISQNWGWPCTALRAQYGQPLAGSGVLNAQSRIQSAEAEIRICFREAKHAATAPSAGPRSDQPHPTWKKFPFGS